jgi:hypothetical protein
MDGANGTNGARWRKKAEFFRAQTSHATKVAHPPIGGRIL